MAISPLPFRAPSTPSSFSPLDFHRLVLGTFSPGKNFAVFFLLIHSVCTSTRPLGQRGCWKELDTQSNDGWEGRSKGAEGRWGVFEADGRVGSQMDLARIFDAMHPLPAPLLFNGPNVFLLCCIYLLQLTQIIPPSFSCFSPHFLLVVRLFSGILPVFHLLFFSSCWVPTSSRCLPLPPSPPLPPPPVCRSFALSIGHLQNVGNSSSNCRPLGLRQMCHLCRCPKSNSTLWTRSSRRSTRLGARKIKRKKTL